MQFLELYENINITNKSKIISMKKRFSSINNFIFIELMKKLKHQNKTLIKSDKYIYLKAKKERIILVLNPDLNCHKNKELNNFNKISFNLSSINKTYTLDYTLVNTIGLYTIDNLSKKDLINKVSVIIAEKRGFIQLLKKYNYDKTTTFIYLGIEETLTDNLATIIQVTNKEKTINIPNILSKKTSYEWIYNISNIFNINTVIYNLPLKKESETLVSTEDNIIKYKEGLNYLLTECSFRENRNIEKEESLSIINKIQIRLEEMKRFDELKTLYFFDVIQYNSFRLEDYEKVMRNEIKSKKYKEKSKEILDLLVNSLLLIKNKDNTYKLYI